MARNRKLWSVPRIQHPEYPGWTMRLTELKPGGPLYAVRMVEGKQRMISLRCTRTDLGRTDKAQREAARAKACKLIARLATEGDRLDTGGAGGENALTMSDLATLYGRHGLHGRSYSYRRDQVAKVARLVRFLGPDRPVVSLSRSDVEAFAAHRQETDGVRQNTVHGDVAALKIAINWATDHRQGSGRSLLAANPLQRVRVGKDPNPRRPWASEERYRKLSAMANELPATFGVLLDLAWATGRRIGAILSLRWQEVDFATNKDCPHGTIRWYAGRASSNKVMDQTVPMNDLVACL